MQSADNVPPKSLARNMAFAKLQSRILSAAEAVQAAKLHSEMLPEQQAIMLSAGGPGSGTCWTAMHKSPTELVQNAQWRMATALRFGTPPDAGLRSTCALRKGNVGDMCEQSLAEHPFHPLCCQYEEARTRPHRAVQHTLRRLTEQAGGYADLERVVYLCLSSSSDSHLIVSQLFGHRHAVRNTKQVLSLSCIMGSFGVLVCLVITVGLLVGAVSRYCHSWKRPTDIRHFGKSLFCVGVGKHVTVS